MWRVSTTEIRLYKIAVIGSHDAYVSLCGVVRYFWWRPVGVVVWAAQSTTIGPVLLDSQRDSYWKLETANSDLTDSVSVSTPLWYGRSLYLLLIYWACTFCFDFALRYTSDSQYIFGHKIIFVLLLVCLRVHQLLGFQDLGSVWYNRYISI